MLRSYSALTSLGKAAREWRNRRQNSRMSNNNSASQHRPLYSSHFVCNSTISSLPLRPKGRVQSELRVVLYQKRSQSVRKAVIMSDYNQERKSPGCCLDSRRHLNSKNRRHIFSRHNAPPCKRIRIPEQENFCLWNPEYRTRNPESHRRLESGIQCSTYKYWNSVPGIRNPWRGIQSKTVLDSLTRGDSAA